MMSFVLFAVGAAIPVFPYLIWSGTAGIIASTIASILGLFVVGGAITLMTGRNPLILRYAPGGLRIGGRSDHLRHWPADRGQCG